MDKKFWEDLNYFIEQATAKRGKELDSEYPDESKHLDFFFLRTREELDDFINNFLQNHRVENKYDFLYMMNSMIKYMLGQYDSHTMVEYENDIWLPLVITCVQNNIYVERTIDENIKKAKLISINGVPIEKILSELEQSVSYGTNGWFLYSIRSRLVDLNTLLSLPSIDSSSEFITYETDKGVLKFPVDKQYKFEFYKKEEDILIRDNTLIFKYNKCNKNHEPDIDKINALIIYNNIQNFVLDLRGNTGGNSEIIKPLIEYLEKSGLNLITLVNRGVYSSGRFAAVDMQRIGSKIIGEEIGTPIDCFGYSIKGGKTPNTGLKFNFSRVYWYEDEQKQEMKGIYTREELRKAKESLMSRKYLKIDDYIDITAEEYENSDEDIFLEYCLRQFCQQRR